MNVPVRYEITNIAIHRKERKKKGINV